MVARIYSPARSAMQSGKGKSKLWLLEFEPETRRMADPLMGWTGTVETAQQIRLKFESLEQAVAYAQKHGFAYEVLAESRSAQMPKSYSDNFKWGRKENWTH